jgi:hypothetical protein
MVFGHLRVIRDDIEIGKRVPSESKRCCAIRKRSKRWIVLHLWLCSSSGLGSFLGCCLVGLAFRMPERWHGKMR